MVRSALRYGSTRAEVLNKELVSPIPEETAKPERRGNRRRQDGDRPRGDRNRRDRRDRRNDSEEKAVKPIQRRKLIKKEEPVAPQVEEAQAEAPVEEAPATEE